MKHYIDALSASVCYCIAAVRHHVTLPMHAIT
jgi:hypothetical protein